MIGMMFGIGPLELFVIVLIVALFAAPFVALGVLIWVLLSRPPRRPGD